MENVTFAPNSGSVFDGSGLLALKLYLLNHVRLYSILTGIKRLPAVVALIYGLVMIPSLRLCSRLNSFSLLGHIYI